MNNIGRDRDLPSAGRGAGSWRPRLSLGRILIYLTLILIAFAMLLPFFWMLSTSFKPERGIFTMPPQWIPDPFTLENYEQVIERTRLVRSLFNSAFVALTSTFGEILTSTLAGFAFARMYFRGRNLIFILLLSTLMLPGVVMLIPTFILFRYMGWIDTYLPLIVPLFFGTAFAIFLSRQFFTSLPKDLESAAKVDGANYLQIYWHVFMPLARPLIATLFILGFLARWNDFLGPLIYLRTGELFTMPLMLAQLNSLYVQQWALLMAGSMIALSPVFIMFILLQRYFVESVAASGIKG
jgi:multiple sugar transport system permease protein